MSPFVLPAMIDEETFDRLLTPFSFTAPGVVAGEVLAVIVLDVSVADKPPIAPPLVVAVLFDNVEFVICAPAYESMPPPTRAEFPLIVLSVTIKYPLRPAPYMPPPF